ncbi:MAG: TetR/AcrR family transcriptional regulator [Desulfobacteraceae bacterium]|nr:TetR/AcrR family transcriptional regulator [Desulfobacteraceae bacterium]
MAKTIKARTPVQKRGIETKAKVVEAAKALFIEKGYYKTHALEIAAQAGVATGTFYMYFNDKKEVLLEVIRQFYRQALEKAMSVLDQDMLRSGDGRKIIHTLIQALYEIHASQYDLHRALFPLTFLIEDGMEISREEERAVIQTIALYFKQYQHLLRVTNLQAAAEIAFKTSDEIIHRVLFWGSESNGKELMGELEEMLFRYLMDSK